MFRRRFLMAALVAGIATLAGPATSNADFRLLITDGTNSVEITDGGLGDLDSVNAGSIIYTNSSLFGGAFSINFAGGTSNSANSGVIGFGALQLNTLTVTNNSGGNQTLTIMLTDNGFTAPLSPGTFVTSSFGGTYLSGQTGDAVSFYGTAGTSLYGSELATTGVSNATLTSNATNTAFSALAGFNGNSTSPNFTPTNPYSLTAVLTLNTESGTQVNTSGTIMTVVPAPTGLVMAATGLPFLGLLRRRLRRAETATAI